MTRPYASALSPEYALLGFLAQTPAHGYELHQRLNRELGQVWHVSLSQTYNILKRLEGRGDISGTLIPQEKLPPRQHYQLTERGKQRLEAWLRAPTSSSVRAIRVEFLTRLYFAQLLGRQTPGQMISDQIGETRAGIGRLEALLLQVPQEQMINRLGLDLRLRQLQAILDWLEGADFGLIVRKNEECSNE